MTSSEIRQLFNQTLIGDYDDDAAWDAVSALQRDGNREVFDIAATWLKDKHPLKRARASAILSQLRSLQSEEEMKALKEPQWLFREETFSLIRELLEHESEVVVLDNAIAALGHLRNDAAISIIIRYKDHPDRNVRFSIAFALGNFYNDPMAVDALISLTRDEDSNVRDWATFGLGVLGDVNSFEIREALLQRVSDPDEDVREEAVVGLGKRQDIRLLPTLRRMLDAPELKERVAEAASEMLGLSGDSAEWNASDYKKALDEKFGTNSLS